jgi:transcriptional regulator with XRE-family HTH domain
VNFGAALKSARKEAGLRQAEVAEKAELDPSYVSMLENNRYSPTLTVYFRLCEVIGISPTELMKRIEAAPSAAAPAKRPRKRS